MTSHPKIFELLKDFLEADLQTERWITVKEFRTYFHLHQRCSQVISGYLQRIYQNPTYPCPYRVTKIEKVRDPSNPYRFVRRYLVEKKDMIIKGFKPHKTAINFQRVRWER